MPDEATAPAEADTPTPTDATLDQDTAAESQQVDWEQRYKDLQSHTTRESQRRAELEDRLNDPDRRSEFLQEWGYELADEEAEDTPAEEPDPYDPEYLHRELQTVKQQLAERQQAEEQAREQQQTNMFIAEQIDAVCEAQKAELDDDEKQLLGDMSLLMRDKRGKPNVEAAYERLFGQFVTAQKKKWARTKRADRPGAGAAATEKVDLDDPRQRQDYMVRRLNEMEDQA